MELGQTGTPDPSQVSYSIIHELGHVFDDVQATQTSSTGLYDLFMQHDFQTMDYDPPTSNTPRNPCNVSPVRGPLISVTNPISHAYFCDGLGGFAAGSSMFAGINPDTGKIYLTHEIIRYFMQPAGNPLPPAITTWGYDYGYPTYQSAGALSPKVGGNPGYQTVPGWREWHSEVLAISLESAISGTPYIVAFPNMRQNGYWSCTAQYAAQENSTGAVPLPANLPQSCQAAMPGWIPIH